MALLGASSFVDEVLRTRLEIWLSAETGPCQSVVQSVVPVSNRKVEKVELPLDSDREIESVVRQFELCRLPYKHWTHRAHLTVAVYYLRRYSCSEALARVRTNINTYNRKRGDPAGYNETVTVMFMRKLASEIRCGRACESMHDEVARVAKLCDSSWLFRYFSRERIFSAEAKEKWVSPDLADIDF